MSSEYEKCRDSVRLQKVLDRSLFKLRDSSGVCNILLVV
jgi:hypothetical protein